MNWTIPKEFRIPILVSEAVKWLHDRIESGFSGEFLNQLTEEQKNQMIEDENWWRKLSLVDRGSIIDDIAKWLDNPEINFEDADMIIRFVDMHSREIGPRNLILDWKFPMIDHCRKAHYPEEEKKQK